MGGRLCQSATTAWMGIALQSSIYMHASRGISCSVTNELNYLVGVAVDNDFVGSAVGRSLLIQADTEDELGYLFDLRGS